MNAYLNAMRRYATFSGRSTRSQFWLYTLIAFLLLCVAAMFDVALGFADEETLVIAGIVYLAHLIPTLAVTVRRLHDIDRTGWWVLIAFVPLVGLIVMLVFFCTPSTPGANRSVMRRVLLQAHTRPLARVPPLRALPTSTSWKSSPRCARLAQSMTASSSA